MAEDFRAVIFQRLKHRNAETHRFAQLIQSNNHLHAEVSSLRRENFQLSIHVEKLKQDNLDLQVKAEAGGSADKSERYVALEQKLFRAQEELTEVHRTKGANAQQLINLNLALQETEKEKTSANELVKQKLEEIDHLKKELYDTDEKFTQSQKAAELIKDEHDALHLMCTQYESKLRDSQAANTEMEKQLLNLKKMQAELIEKERESVNQKIEGTPVPPPQSPTSNGSPPNSEESPRKTVGRSLISGIGGAISDLFNKKPVVRTTSNEVYTERSISYQGCAYVKLPSRPKCKWKAHDGEVTAAKFSSSGDILATGGSDKLIRIWTVVGEKCLPEHVLRGSNGGITNIDFDPNEQLLIACSTDYAVRLWTLSTQRLKLTLTGHAGKVLSARYLSYGQRLVSGSNDRTVKVWDLKGGACVKTYLAGSSCNDVVTTDQSGECIASGHFDRKLRFYDTRAGSSASFELALGGRITSLDTPLDKNAILCCTKDHTLEIVDMRKRKVLKSFSHDFFKVATENSRCAYSPTGEYVAVGSSDGTVLVWNALNGDLVTTVQHHDDPVISCCWNGGSLLTGDKGRHCILWTDT